MQLFAGTCLAILFFLLFNVHCMSASKAPSGQSFCKNKQLAKHRNRVGIGRVVPARQDTQAGVIDSLASFPVLEFENNLWELGTD
jgi:hypothetical protein